MSTDNNYYTNILNNTIHYLHQYVIPIFYIIGNVGNLLNAFIFSKKSWKKNVCVFYFNICIIFNTCYINLVVLADFLSGFNIEPYNSNVPLCKLYFYMVFLFSMLYPTVLILASVDRLLISSQNVDTRLYSSKRLAYFSVTLNTFIWIIAGLHLLIKVNIQEKSPSHFVCYYDLSTSYRHFISYSSLISNSLICFIMIILCMLAFKNVRRIRAIPRQQRHEIRTMTKKDFQLLRCLFVQDIVYTIFSISLSVFTVYETATIYRVRTPFGHAGVDFFHNLSEFIHHIPYCLNFYIYVLVSKAFRNELRRMIYKIRGKDMTSLREEEIKQDHVGKDNLELNVAVINHVV